MIIGVISLTLLFAFCMFISYWCGYADGFKKAKTIDDDILTNLSKKCEVRNDKK
jgi:hypothetical protein